MKYKLTKEVVLAEIVEAFPTEPKITSLADNARAFNYIIQKKGIVESAFCMLGAMGQEISMGLGVSLALRRHTNKQTVVISSDGSLLANTNGLVTIGTFSEVNLVIIVLDNETYQVTGNQPTASRTISLAALAEACNLRVYTVSDQKELKKILQDVRKVTGPVFVHVKINNTQAKVLEITELPAVSFRDFSNYLHNQDGFHKKI